MGGIRTCPDTFPRRFMAVDALRRGSFKKGQRHVSAVVVLGLLVLSLVSVGRAIPLGEASQPGTAPSSKAQSPSLVHPALRSAPSKPALKGRFLHITDIHPDPHYVHGTAERKHCHRGKPKKNKKTGDDFAGYWGTPVSDCDAPYSLVNATLDWLKREWAEEVDFVVWTGDSARHDIDSKIPRSPEEIYDSNRWMASKMEETFGPEIPIVPTLGNNDIHPHNIFYPGPSEATIEYANIWKHFIPEASFHAFHRGAYFSSEVIPDELAVISLNTLYFSEFNKAMDGCHPSHEEDPGTIHLDWLEEELDMFRQRGMQVYLVGHVPPTPGNYFAECYSRYAEIILRFQDTLVGQLFGHMNVDAIFLVEDGDTAERVRPDTTNRAGLPKDLRENFNSLPAEGQANLSDYSVINVAPSVIPTYLPCVRVFTYNTTKPASEGKEPTTANVLDDELWDVVDGETATPEDVDSSRPKMVFQLGSGSGSGLVSSDEGWESLDESETLERKKKRKDGKGKHGKDRKKKKKKKKNKEGGKGPKHVSPDSPVRTNTYLTPLGWSQFFVDLERENERFEGKKKVGGEGEGGRVGANAAGRQRGTSGKGKRGKEEGGVVGSGFDDVGNELRWRLEYTTYDERTLWGPLRRPLQAGSEAEESERVRGGGEGDEREDEQDRGPVPVRLLEHELFLRGLLPTALFSLGKSSSSDEDDNDAPLLSASTLRDLSHEALTMPDLTLPSYLDLLRRLASDDDAWEVWKRRMYVQSGAHEE